MSIGAGPVPPARARLRHRPTICRLLLRLPRRSARLQRLAQRRRERGHEPRRETGTRRSARPAYAATAPSEAAGRQSSRQNDRRPSSAAASSNCCLADSGVALQHHRGGRVHPTSSRRRSPPTLRPARLSAWSIAEYPPRRSDYEAVPGRLVPQTAQAFAFASDPTTARYVAVLWLSLPLLTPRALRFRFATRMRSGAGSRRTLGARPKQQRTAARSGLFWIPVCEVGT